jgi:hypothetical protein
MGSGAFMVPPAPSQMTFVQSCVGVPPGGGITVPMSAGVCEHVSMLHAAVKHTLEGGGHWVGKRHSTHWPL